jgi:hypothetical protein
LIGLALLKVSFSRSDVLKVSFSQRELLKVSISRIPD